MGLLESLEEDQKAAKLNSEGEPDNGKSTESSSNGDDQGGADSAARGRIASRRAARNAGASSQDESGASQKDGGASRGTRGDPQGSGEGAPADAQAPQGADGTPSGSEGDGGVLEEKELTHKEQAYYRRIAREEQAKNKVLEQQLAELKKAPGKPVEEPAAAVAKDPAKTVENPEPDKEKDLAGWLVWNAEEQRKWRAEQTAQSTKTQEEQRVSNLVQSAKQEIEEIQTSYRKTNPDYDNALTHAKTAYSQAVKTLNPNMSEAQIKQAIDKEIFNIALKCDREGTNLGEVIYDMAIERFGYDPDTESKPSTTATPRPNLRVVSNNKRRSASALEGGGQRAAGRITLEAASQMSPGELNALSPEDWSYLESQGF